MTFAEKNVKVLDNIMSYDWRQDIKDPQLGELYFDIATLTMWEYKSLGDSAPEWINVSAFLDEYEDKFI